MKELKQANDYYGCIVKSNKNQDNFSVVEKAYNEKEQSYIDIIADGFKSHSEAYGWILDKRREQVSKSFERLMEEKN